LRNFQHRYSVQATKSARDFGFPPRSRWHQRSSGILRSG